MSEVHIPELFGCLVFNDKVMRERLPQDAYAALKNTMQLGKKLAPDLADIVAEAMKDWAIENGCTHYSHWFQPMTGVTAEKHDSFIEPDGKDSVLMEFSGKALVKGEPDASSFPSGGLRATFEARGYTAWDPTSYAFIKNETLCIPTAFYSYGGEALDQKTPLLRSMEAINRQALRVLRLFGDNETRFVHTNVGPEQEYFLIDKNLYNRREDLILTGRTLFGAKPPRGQEMDDHYFGSIRPRVIAFMKELDEELWKHGIYAKTRHNEAAPAQHEMAPVFTSTNLATDGNQLTMELMKKVAEKHGLACLLHEKPFEGVNGSGKHNNWSLSTDSGVNLLNPGSSPRENAQFLLFLVAVIKAVDEHQDLLRISVASAGNDHRLGAAEAPPAVVSIFLGNELTEILESLESDTPYESKEAIQMKVGVHVLPRFPKDNSDRNRTSPLAFTGNKFELRMLGSAASISAPNTMLNTGVADVLMQFADELENAKDLNAALHALIKREFHAHKRIIFNGNGYDDAWMEEAARRGLLNLKHTPDALPLFTHPKNLELFARHKVFTSAEMFSRCEIMQENYCKVLLIEARTMLDMAQKEILPAASAYVGQLSATAVAAKAISPAAGVAEAAMVEKLSALTASLYAHIEELKAVLAQVDEANGAEAKSRYFCDVVIPVMNALRADADELEASTAKSYWPYPTYSDMLFYV